MQIRHTATWHEHMAEAWRAANARMGSWGWLRGSIGKRSSIAGPRGTSTKQYATLNRSRENARRQRQIAKGTLRVMR